jgi:hypothetical protein
VARFCAILLMGAVSLCPLRTAAQSPGEASDAVRVGDWWTYDRKDELTGLPLSSYTSTILEISPTEIITRFELRGRTTSSTVIFDHDWNRTANGNSRYKPNDGHGVQLPLAVNREWQSEYEVRNVQNGAAAKGTSSSKVLALETLNTPTGMFETYKIERQVKEVSATGPSRLTEIQFDLWFAPLINHWVRRTTLTKLDKRTRSNETDELTGFGRKQ